MKILVVEDDRILNTTLCYNLSAAGYEVATALTKSAAERLCKKQEYDLIVLDINLPDGNGFDFCRDIKERHPDTAVIFLTANDMESDMLKGNERGGENITPGRRFFCGAPLFLPTPRWKTYDRSADLRHVAGKPASDRPFAYDRSGADF